MNKEVEKNGRNEYIISNKKANIIRNLVLGIKTSDIAKKHDIGIKAVHKHKYEAIKRGIITKDLTLTDKGRKTLIYGNFKVFRLHNVKTRIKVPQIYREKLKRLRYNILSLKKISYDKKLLGNTDCAFFEFGRAKVRVYPESVLIQMPEIWGVNEDEATETLIYLIFDYVEKIERLYKIELIQDNKINMSIISSECAHVNNVFAQKFKNDGNNFYLRDKDNDLRLIVDFSKGVPEFEGVHRNYAEPDIAKVNRYIADWIEHDSPTNSELSSALVGLIKRDEFHAENIKSHVWAIQELGRSTTKLDRGIQELIDLIKKLKGDNGKDL